MTLTGKVAIVTGGNSGIGLGYARGLAAAFDAEPPKEAAASIKAAALQGATLVVVAQRARGARLPFTATENAVRDCRRPILFVPPV